MSPAEYLGIVAGIFTTFAVIPQIMRVYKLKSAREISLIFTTSLLVGIIIWLVYGIMLGLYSIIIWNSIGIALNGWLLFVKFKYGRVKNA
jgi:MtN3 and saliva related transmembrane protein